MKKFVVLLLLSSSAFGQSIFSVKDLQDIRFENFKKSLLLEFFYTNDYLSTTGGTKAGPRNIGALDLYLTSDFNKFTRWDGQLMVHYNHVSGLDSRGAIGDYQGTSNIEMPSQVDRLTDLWYQGAWNDKVKTLVGIHDLSTAFNVTDSSFNFINASFGTSAEISFSGPAGAPIYPVTSVGIKNDVQFTEELLLQAALYDATAGDQSTWRSFHSDVGNDDGFLAITELAYETELQKIGLGGWAYTKKLPKYLDETEEGTSAGAYTVLQHAFTPNLIGFFRYGWANPEVSAIQSNTVVGGVYRGLLQRKNDEDEIGLGVSSAKFSGNHRKELEDPTTLGGPPAETVYEAYYQFKPLKYLQLRPDVQYVARPAGLGAVDDAWSFGFRSVIQL